MLMIQNGVIQLRRLILIIKLVLLLLTIRKLLGYFIPMYPKLCASREKFDGELKKIICMESFFNVTWLKVRETLVHNK